MKLRIWRDFFAALVELARMTKEERQAFWINESKD